MNNRDQIKKYFKPFPMWAIGAIGFGVLLFFAKWWLGLLCIGVGVAAFTMNKKPTEAEIDQWLGEDLKTIRDKAQKKLGLESEEVLAEPFVLDQGVVFRGWAGTQGIPAEHLPPDALKVGDTGKLRLGTFKYQLFFPVEKFLGSYTCVWDFCEGKAYHEGTEEFFYKDVVSVNTKSSLRDVETKKNGKISIEFNEFKLTVSSGDSIDVAVVSEGMKDKRLLGGDASKLAITSYDSTIQAIRKMLRDKK